MKATFSKTVLAPALCTVILLGAEPARSQGQSYGWSISASNTDAYDNHIDFVPGLHSYYLWLLCGPGFTDGMSSAEFDLAAAGADILAFTPLNGFANAGDATNLLLTVGGCPPGPVIAGEILAVFTEPGNLCLTASENGVLGTTGCDGPPVEPDAWRGLEFGGAFCAQGFVCDFVDSTLPCCFPDGTCSHIPAIDFEELCTGYGPPVQFCSDWECEPTPVEPKTWGWVKTRYRGP